MPKVLCVSYDNAVALARMQALKESGYDVASALKPAEAIRMLEVDHFEAVVIGHRFSKTERQHLAELAREKNTPVVLICGTAADPDIAAAGRVYALEGIVGLERVLRSVVPCNAAATAK